MKGYIVSNDAKIIRGEDVTRLSIVLHMNLDNVVLRLTQHHKTKKFFWANLFAGTCQSIENKVQYDSMEEAIEAVETISSGVTMSFHGVANCIDMIQAIECLYDYWKTKPEDNNVRS